VVHLLHADWTVVSRPSAARLATRQGRRFRSILIVEDDTDLRDVFAMYFELRSFQVFVASDGEHALRLALTEVPDVIVMDLSLPHLDGWETTRLLKQTPSTAHIPIIACTGALLGRAAERALDAGCDAYLTKPCSAKELCSEVERLLAFGARAAGAA